MLPFAIRLETRPRLIAHLGAFALLMLMPAMARAQTPVVFGDTISEPGVYFLLGNQSGSGVGITIESDDVALLLLRFTLRGDTMSDGIFVDGHDNVNVFGGRITNFGRGIFMTDCHDCTLKDTRIDHCRGDGVNLIHFDAGSCLRLRCDHNGSHGLDAITTQDARFLSILSHDNGADGIHLDFLGNVLAGAALGRETHDNKIKLCWAADNGRDGIRLVDADDNDLERNQCVHNHDAGIRLDSFSDSDLQLSINGADGNFLRSNWCVFNHDGIVVEWNSSSNTMTNNTALANLDDDMRDENSEVTCANTWFLNFFLLKGGAGSGCIF